MIERPNTHRINDKYGLISFDSQYNRQCRRALPVLVSDEDLMKLFQVVI